MLAHPWFWLGWWVGFSGSMALVWIFVKRVVNPWLERRDDRILKEDAEFRAKKNKEFYDELARRREATRLAALRRKP